MTAAEYLAAFRKAEAEYEATFRDLVNMSRPGNHEAREAARVEMGRLANEVDLTDSFFLTEKPESVYKTVYCDMYRSQGLGMLKYTREAAELVVEALLAGGLKAEVVEINDHEVDVMTNYRGGTTPTRFVDYEVRVNLNRDAMDMLNSRAISVVKELPLREWVRQCWQRGVNPRVYRPNLPAGYEEDHDLDYFGNDNRNKLKEEAQRARDGG